MNLSNITGTIITNSSNITLDSQMNFGNISIYNTSFRCVCPGLNTDFGYLFILGLILFICYLPDNSKWFIKLLKQEKFNLDKIYYVKFSCLITIIVLLSFSSKNWTNTILYLASFLLLGKLVGDRYFKN